MLAAVVAQAVAHERGALHDLVAVGVLAVERAQRIELGALAALVAHLIGMVEDELAHGLAVGGAARGIAHGVDE